MILWYFPLDIVRYGFIVINTDPKGNRVPKTDLDVPRKAQPKRDPPQRRRIERTKDKAMKSRARKMEAGHTGQV